MKTEDKLNRIIKLFEKTYSKLPKTLLQAEPITEEITIIHKKVDQRQSQLRDKRLVEMVAHADRNSFTGAWKKEIADLIEIRKTKTGFFPVFKIQALKWFDNQFKNPNHPFYIELQRKP